MGKVIKWTEEEDRLLKENYQLKKKDLLKLIPNRSPAAVNIRASLLGLKKERNEYVESQCDVLLENTILSYYWIGFILADGHIENKRRLAVTLAASDKKYLAKLAKFLECGLSFGSTKKYYYCSLACQDKYVIPKLAEKFDIHSNKTENPPNLNTIPQDDDLLLAVFCGFIDGDGCIRYQTGRKDCSIRFHLHSSWLSYFIQIWKRLNKIYNVSISPPKIQNDGYLGWSICNRKVVNELKKFTISNKLPTLQRKWLKINLNLSYSPNKASYHYE